MWKKRGVHLGFWNKTLPFDLSIYYECFGQSQVPLLKTQILLALGYMLVPFILHSISIKKTLPHFTVSNWETQTPVEC